MLQVGPRFRSGETATLVQTGVYVNDMLDETIRPNLNRFKNCSTSAFKNDTTSTVWHDSHGRCHTSVTTSFRNRTGKVYDLARGRNKIVVCELFGIDSPLNQLLIDDSLPLIAPLLCVRSLECRQRVFVHTSFPTRDTNAVSGG
jgi:hypothetical protein